MVNGIQGKFPYNMICEIAKISYTENIEQRKISMFLDLYKLLAGDKGDYLACIYSNPDKTILSISNEFNIASSGFGRIRNTIFSKIRYYVILMMYSGVERLNKVLDMRLDDIYGGGLSQLSKNRGSIFNIKDMKLQEYLSVPVALVSSMKTRYILHGKLRLGGISTDLVGNNLPLFVNSFTEMYYPVCFLRDLTSRIYRRVDDEVRSNIMALRTRVGIENLLRASLNFFYTMSVEGILPYQKRSLSIFKYRYVYAMTLADTGSKIGIAPENVRTTINVKLLSKLGYHLINKLPEIVELSSNGVMIPLVDSSLEVLADLHSGNSLISTLTIDSRTINIFDCCSINEILSLSNERVYSLLKSENFISELYNALERRGYYSFSSGEPFKLNSLCPYQDKLMEIITRNGGF